MHKSCRVMWILVYVTLLAGVACHSDGDQDSGGPLASRIPEVGGGGAGISNVDLMVYDVFGPPARRLSSTQTLQWGDYPWGTHELIPKGVPTGYDWRDGARPGRWDVRTAGGITPWGQIYEAESGSPIINLRLHIRNMELYFLHGDSLWRRAGAWNTFDGGYWTPDFTTKRGALPLRNEPAGGQSFPIVIGRVGHWWNSGPRVAIPVDAVALHVRIQMCLIPDTDASVDISQARFVAGQAADAFQTASPQFSGNYLGDFLEPRHKVITADWKWFTATTRYEAELRANPPPPF